VIGEESKGGSKDAVRTTIEEQGPGRKRKEEARDARAMSRGRRASSLDLGFVDFHVSLGRGGRRRPRGVVLRQAEALLATVGFENRTRNDCVEKACYR
jgi:hypothetical protein